MRKNYGPIFFALVLLPALLFTTRYSISQSKAGRGVQKGFRLATTFGVDRPFWAPNRIGNYISNNGQLVSQIPTSSSGMEWTVGSRNYINFASGIWLAGIEAGEIVTAAAEYSTEFQPGKITGHAAGTAGTPENAADPRFKVYIINREDVANPSNNPDYLNWPAADGAPVNADGTPQLLGTSTTWAVFNDLDEVLHARLLGSQPLGIEVQQTAFAFNRADVFGDMLFFKFKIINKGSVNIDSCFISFWVDVDVGDALDLVGCDTTLSLGFNYKTQADNFYGNVAPAIGYVFFQGPIVPSPGDTALVSGRKVPNFRNLPMTSFAKYISGPPQYSDAEFAAEAYSFMNGFDKVGDPIVNPQTNQVTKFWHPGDPVTGTGWLDDVHDDKRFLMSSGPFTLAVGDTQEVVGAIIIAQGEAGLASVRLLKQNDLLAQLAYENQWVITGVEEVPAPLPNDYSLQQNYPNPFNPSTNFEFSIPRDEFVSLKIYNLLGEEVAVVVAENHAAGQYKVNWDAAGLAGGIYFYRLQAGTFVQTRKLALLK